MNKTILTLVLLILIIKGQAQTKDTIIFKQIFIEYLNYRESNDNTDSLRIVIDNTPTNKIKLDSSDYSKFKKKYKKLQRSTFENFVKRSKENLDLNNLRQDNLRIKILDDIGFTDWDNFYKTFPKTPGIIELSNVGFNETQTQAIIYFGQQRHYLNGGGQYIIYEFKNDKWTKVKEIGIWAS